MNIGITVYPTYGGSGIVGSELGKELAARGHTVHFISSALPTRLTELNERVRFHEVEMMSYPLFEHQPYTLALATKMATVAEEENHALAGGVIIEGRNGLTQRPVQVAGAGRVLLLQRLDGGGETVL